MSRAVSWMLVAAAMIAVGCKGKSEAPSMADSETPRPTAPVAARIPAGPVPVTLPELTGLGRRVTAAKAFVTIAKDGARTAGPLAPGPTPYAGKSAAARSLDELLFPTAGAAAPSDDGALPQSAADAGAGSASKPSKPSKASNELAARKLAIEAALSAGVLSLPEEGESIASLFDDSDGDILAGLVGDAPPAGSGNGPTPDVRLARLLHVQGVLYAGGELDALILADAASPASGAVSVLSALRARTTSLAVVGQGAPDAVPYRFSQEAKAPARTSVRVALSEREVRVRDASGGSAKSVPFADGIIVREPLIAALREARTNAVAEPIALFLDGPVTAQQVVDVLGAMAAIGVSGVSISALPPRGGGGVGPVVGDGWGVIGTLSSDGESTSRTSPGGPLLTAGTGAFDPKIVTRVLRRQLGKVEACYAKRLAVMPALAGTVTARFAISPKGKVSSSSATGVDPEVARCVAGVIEGVQFPAPKSGGVEVEMPFTFQPSAAP